MTEPVPPEAVQQPLQRFLQQYEPLRPELYRYCRYLTRSPWDAEDLAQDALARAFVTLGRMLEPPAEPRAWLFRVASNLRIHCMRRALPLAAAEQEPFQTAEPRATREAAGTLLVRLSPQERAAVVLADVFELSNEEIAQTLGTSLGAVKAALHRGRGKLLPDAPPAPELQLQPSRGVLDAFCQAFNARDVPRLTALLLDQASVEVVGAASAFEPGPGRDGMFQGMLFGSARMAAADTQGGMDPRFIQGVLPEPPRAELRVHRGEWLILFFYKHLDGEHVRAITRFQTEGAHIARVQNYFFTPELLAEVCAELSVPFRSNGYRSCFS